MRTSYYEQRPRSHLLHGPADCVVLFLVFDTDKTSQVYDVKAKQVECVILNVQTMETEVSGIAAEPAA